MGWNVVEAQAQMNVLHVQTDRQCGEKSIWRLTPQVQNVSLWFVNRKDTQGSKGRYILLELAHAHVQSERAQTVHSKNNCPL